MNFAAAAPPADIPKGVVPEAHVAQGRHAVQVLLTLLDVDEHVRPNSRW